MAVFCILTARFNFKFYKIYVPMNLRMTYAIRNKSTSKIPGAYSSRLRDTLGVYLPVLLSFLSSIFIAASPTARPVSAQSACT